MYGVVTDDGDVLEVVLRGANIKDPLAKLRSFYAKVSDDAGKKVIDCLLIDTDWCVRK